MSATNSNTRPSEWDTVSVASLGQIVSGGTPSRTVRRFWNGSIPWVTPTEITALDDKWLGYTKEHITEAGLRGSAAKLLPTKSVVVTTRATLGARAITQVALTTNQGFKSIVPNEETDSLWCYYAVELLQREMERRAVGTTFLEISKGDFESIPLCRPLKLEQSRIAEILDTLDAAIRETESVVSKLRQVKAGLLHDLLTRGLDEHGNLRDPAGQPEQFQDSPLGRIPKAWQVGVLDSAVRIIDCKHYTPRFVAEGIPFIRPRNVKAEGLDFTDVDYVSLADYTLLTDKHEPAQGDIVFSRNASFGVSCFVVKPLRFAIGQDIVIMTRRAAETRFVFYVLRSFVTEQQVARVSTGSTFGRINLEFIRALQVVLPSLEEQKNIVRILDAHGERFEAEELKLSKLHSLKRGLAHDLLTGRVRVKVGAGA